MTKEASECFPHALSTDFAVLRQKTGAGWEGEAVDLLPLPQVGAPAAVRAIVKL